MDELKEDLEIFAAQHAIKVPKSTDQYIKPQYQDVGVPAAASFAPASARKPGIAPAATHKSGSAPVVSNRGLSAQQLKIAIAFSLALAVFAIVLSVVTLFFSPAKQKNSRLHTSPNSAGAGAGNGTVLTDKCQAPVRKTDAVPEHQRGKSENNSQTTRKKILAAHKEKNKSQTNRSGDDEALLESIYLKKHAGDSTQKWIEIQQKEQSQ